MITVRVSQCRAMKPCDNNSNDVQRLAYLRKKQIKKQMKKQKFRCVLVHEPNISQENRSIQKTTQPALVM